MCPVSPSAACLSTPAVSDAVISGSQRSRAAVPSCGARRSLFHDHARRPSRSSAHPFASMRTPASALAYWSCSPRDGWDLQGAQALHTCVYVLLLRIGAF